MTTSNQKVNSNNCTHGQLLKDISKIQTKAAVTFVKDDKWIGHHMKHITHMAEHYVVSANYNFGMTREGHPKLLNQLPSEFRATQDCWDENVTPPGRLLTATYTYQGTGNQIQVHQTMNGVAVDTRSDEFQTMYQNFIAYHP